MANVPRANTLPLIEHLAQQLKYGPQANQYLVAYSAGADSSALLHALTQLDIRQSIHALHINHGLQAQSDHWAQLAQSNCNAWNVPLHIQKVSVIAGKHGLEAAARKARYDAIKQHLQNHTVVLMAHHRDDQAETLLLNLFRGSGVRGLSGIPKTRPIADATIYRPLLELPRQQLRQYCHQQKLSYIEDSSNQDLRFDRNWLRHELLPFIEQRFGKASNNMAISAQLLRQTFNINQQFIEQQLLPLLDKQNSLNLQQLRLQPEFLQHELLRTWIRNQQYTPPPRQQLKEFIRQLNTAKADKAPQLLWENHQLCVYQQRLSIQKATDQPALKESQWRLPDCFVWPNVGKLAIQNKDQITPANQSGRWPVFTVTQRRGGETILLADGHHHSFKKLCQQAGIPPWKRSQMPMVYHRKKLVAIADLWLHPALQRWLQRHAITWQWYTVK